MAGGVLGVLGVRAGRRGRRLRSLAAVWAALAALVLCGGNAVAATVPHWSLVASPNFGARYNYLTGVSCASARFCMGVGYYYDGTVWRTLVLRWNGTRWARVASPDPGTTDYNDLEGVSCLSASFCMAAGYYYNGTTALDLMLRWNGTKWAQVSAPHPGVTSELYGVSCPRAGFCMADGWYYSGTTQQTVMLRWHGTRWARVTSPDSSTTESNELFGVSCASPGFCQADGWYITGAGATYRTLALKWNGTKWAKVSSPDPGTGTGQDNELAAMSCPSATFCMATGYYNNGTAWQTLALKWNGTKWTTVASPDPGTGQNNLLEAVSCPSATFCMATGYYNNGTTNQTLMLRWNGTRWATVPSPDRGTSDYNYLYAVNCTSTR